MIGQEDIERFECCHFCEGSGVLAGRRCEPCLGTGRAVRARSELALAAFDVAFETVSRLRSGQHRPHGDLVDSGKLVFKGIEPTTARDPLVPYYVASTVLDVVNGKSGTEAIERFVAANGVIYVTSAICSMLDGRPPPAILSRVKVPKTTAPKIARALWDFRTGTETEQ